MRWVYAEFKKLLRLNQSYIYHQFFQDEPKYNWLVRAVRL